MEVVAAGLKAAYRMASGSLPLLLAGFLLAGFASVFIPKGLIGEWLGKESGLSGVLIGSAAGVLLPGVTSTIFPLIALLVDQGIARGPLIAYLSAWGLCQMQRLIVWEIPFLGLPLALLRFAVCLLLPPFIGLAVAKLSR